MNADPVPELRQLLGQQTVFIAWPKGTKGTNMKWGHLTIADLTPEFLAKLSEGNIGVALGQPSGHLIAIDIDDDSLVDPFLALNPSLATTLQTHGARGRVFWLRVKGGYPKKTIKLKTQSGKAVGEIRSNGSQSIVWGIHPDTNLPYQFVVRQPVVEIEFGSIKWPSQIINPVPPQHTEGPEANISHTSVSSVASATSGASVPSAPSGSSVSSGSSVQAEWFFSISTVNDALRVSMPHKVHENNQHLFTLARAVKALEAQAGQRYTPGQLRDILNQWHAQAKPLLRPGQTLEDYWLEFLNAYGRAKYPLGSIIIPKAWKLAQEKPPPPEAMQFENPELRLLVALCRELQILNGANPFYLSSRMAQRLFGHKSHSTIATRIGALCTLQIIEEIEKGNAHRATRYRYRSGIT